MTAMPPCGHCKVDPHSGETKQAEQQLRGVWLCRHHLDTAELVNGRLMHPIGSRREDERQRSLFM